MKTAIVWFRNDLRVHDQPALSAAIHDFETVVPVFILNDAILRGQHASPNRNRFLLESLHDLKSSLMKMGANLVIRHGDAANELRKLAQETDAEVVYYSIDYTPRARQRDHQVTEALAEHNIALQAFPGRLVIDSFKGLTTASGQTYKVFTPFWKNWMRLPRRETVPAPRRVTLPSRVTVGHIPALSAVSRKGELSPDIVVGGETAGRQRMHDWLEHGLSQYHDTHNALGRDGTSRLSAYLHLGCISARELEALLPDTGKGPAAFNRQLAWRDFYNYILFHFPDNAHTAFQPRYRKLQWEQDDAAFKAWQQGKTGYPIVDAAMRQLQREGWMHNRARLIVGSFLTKDLGLDWRLGERHFMQLLIDGDEANNNGNWQWITSIGVDPAPLFRRLYNPVSQQKNYDPDGSYVRQYVPELAKVEDIYLAEPHRMSQEEQAAAGCTIGKDYPAPIVDHAEARQQTIERYKKV